MMIKFGRKDNAFAGNMQKNGGKSGRFGEK